MAFAFRPCRVQACGATPAVALYDGRCPRLPSVAGQRGGGGKEEGGGGKEEGGRGSGEGAARTGSRRHCHRAP
eukprot:7231679-Prymnesium_polylepis.1